jgi:ABC-type transporter Mla MlaB component
MSFGRRTGLYGHRHGREARLEVPEGSRRRELRPAADPNEMVIVIDGPTAPADVGELCERLRRQVEGSPTDLILCDAGALVDPDLAAIDALARLQLTARRLGCRIRLRGACGELRDLLSLSGLDEVVSVSERLRPQPGRQAEEREPSLGVEEEGDPGDPVA